LVDIKMGRHAEKPHSEKWIILIAYIMGLSIGVHLLNLLCIPAIVFGILLQEERECFMERRIGGFIDLLCVNSCPDVWDYPGIYQSRGMV